MSLSLASTAASASSPVGSRTALPRDQTLRALVDWSYDRLSETEQTVMRKLAVFAGGWTLAAAEDVCSPTPDIVEMLGRSVAKSLVIVAAQQGATRYNFLETIRQYAAEKLEERGEEAVATGRRHAECFMGLAERSEPMLRSAEQRTTLDRLSAEHDNLRAALRWSIEHAETETALRLCGALWRFWWIRGRSGRGAALAGPGACAARRSFGHGAGEHAQRRRCAGPPARRVRPSDGVSLRIADAVAEDRASAWNRRDVSKPGLGRQGSGCPRAGRSAVRAEPGAFSRDRRRLGHRAGTQQPWHDRVQPAPVRTGRRAV